MAVPGPRGAEAERAFRQALRIALAAATGFVLAVVLGSPLPFLAPLLAAQFLMTSRRPMRPARAIGGVLLVLVVGQTLSLAFAALGERPVVLAPLLWLLYLACFVAQGRGAGAQAATLALTVAVMVPLLDMTPLALGSPAVLVVAGALIGGAMLAWAAHAALPDPGGEEAPAPTSTAGADPGLRRAAASATILLAAVVICFLDSRLSVAIVIPVTVASVLGQLDFAAGRHAALSIVVVNLLGGVAASIAFTVIQLGPTLPVLFLVVLLAGLMFGAGTAAAGADSARVHAGALTVFLILLGLGVSPLPTDTPASFASRLAYVSAAVVGTLWACLLLWPRRSVGRAV